VARKGRRGVRSEMRRGKTVEAKKILIKVKGIKQN
jgi:hypothetical protein